MERSIHPWSGTEKAPAPPMTAPATNAIATIPQKGAFDEAVKALCFEIWLFLADRNAEDTVRLLAERLANVAPEDAPQLQRLPSVRTVQNWAKTENWAIKANDLIRHTAEHIDEEQIARLFVLSDKAINLAHRIIDGEFLNHPRTGNVAIMADMVKEILKFRGLGTAGVLGAPTLHIKVENAVEGLPEMTLEEKSEAMRQRTLKGKELKRLTGRSS
jgi:hypothetical protein